MSAISQKNHATKPVKLYRIPDLIAKKRDGGELLKEEMDFIVDSVVKETIAECQIGALLMAIYLHGLTASETSSLTRAMTYSGETLHWPLEWNGCVVDKHSTGGVGDKVSLALAPALAACGVKVPMISGRGLGHTGGTLDKLESIPGFCSSITADQIRNILANVGCCIVGQTKDIVPADRVLYAMRDVSSTVDSLPLIASSIVSKKAAENLTALVLDVKYGRGAFMEKEADARSLAETMVEASNSMGVKTVALLTNMNNPIGFAVGNHLEVIEAIRCLHGNGPADLQYLVGQLGGRLLYKAGKVTSSTEGVNLILEKLQDKSALHTFRRMCVAQGAAEETMKELCSENADFTKLFRQSKFTTQLRSPVTGYVHQIDALCVARASLQLGAGRTVPNQAINHSVGVHLETKYGEKINTGDAWATVYHEDEQLPQQVRHLLENALLVAEDAPLVCPLVKAVIE